MVCFRSVVIVCFVLLALGLVVVLICDLLFVVGCWITGVFGLRMLVGGLKIINYMLLVLLRFGLLLTLVLLWYCLLWV